MGRLGSFILAAIAGLVITMSAFVEPLRSTRLFVVLVALLLLHLIRFPRFLFCREFALYSALACYMLVALLWTADIGLALNLLPPTLNFVLILIVFGALVTYHDVRAVLAGILGGFLLGAAIYTFTAGFPFVYPEEFSYNTFAGMYLFGLFASLLYGWHRGSTFSTLLIGLLLLALILATTSIKTNLGILLGGVAACVVYFKSFAKTLRGGAVYFVLLAGILAYAVASNDAFLERFQAGYDRVALGIEVLGARDDTAGSLGIDERKAWKDEGLKGWARHPLFGNGVEAFRHRYETTSHSTPIDLLYNFGLIGLALFYSIFVSIAWRLYRARHLNSDKLQALVLGAIVCYVFISLSGTTYYDTFLAATIGLSTALLRQNSNLALRTIDSPTNAST